MRTSRQMGVTLSPEQEQDVETWLRGPVARAYDAVIDGSADLLNPEAVRQLDRTGGSLLDGIGCAGLPRTISTPAC